MSLSRIWPQWKNASVLGSYSKGQLQKQQKEQPLQRVSDNIGKHLVNPKTGQPTELFVLDTPPTQVDTSIEQARQAQQEWSALPGATRRDGLLALADAVTQHKTGLARLEILQTGKPLQDALGEVDETIASLRYFAGYCDKPHGSSLVQDALHMTTQSEPIGVCGLITSFNYPLMLTGWKLAPALAAGNSVIIKPAPQTPLTTLALAELTRGILPTDVMQVLPGGLATGQAVVAGVDKTSFTGSTPAGQAIMRQAANRLSPLTLECGGKNTVIVDMDVNVAEAAYHVAQGAFSNAGQNCCAISRVLVHSLVYDEFVQHLIKETERWQPVSLDDDDNEISSSSSSSTYYYGPLIDQQQYDRVRDYLQHTTYTPLYQGQIHFSTKATGGGGYYVPPTIFAGVNDDDKLAQDEIFGPVVSLLSPFDTMDEAIARANATPFGLAAGVFSRQYPTAHAVASKLQAGIVWINTYNMIPPSIPFGGRKLSGIGKDLGKQALDEFSFTKSILHSL